MSSEYYQSTYSGAQIDNVIGRILNGELDEVVKRAAAAAQGVVDTFSESDLIVSSKNYGTTLPEEVKEGRVFFLLG